MEFSYKKNDNTDLFRDLEKDYLTNISKLQNYIPIYDKFFSLNETNYNSINLNNNYIKSIDNKESENKYKAVVCDYSNNEKICEVFFKYSPLLDPVKYITGKYDTSQNILDLPIHNTKIGYAKIRDPNNSAYVDGFFSYLTSRLLNEHKFIHGIDYYGSFLGVKNNFLYDISDEIEYLYDSDFFHKNNNILFKLDNNIHSDLLNKDTRNYKNKINICNDISNNMLNNYDELKDINDLFIVNNTFSKDSSNVELCYEGNIKETEGDNESINSCSSTSSYSDEENETVSNSDSSDNSSMLSDDVINININEFPIQLIALERCNNTLDSLMNEENISDKELSCIVVQILMMLITYQKVFKFTHNDLHTNNIMYVETDKKYLIYKYNDKNYKIETYGKIFKLIDFGRAVYSFRNNLICSDSYHPKGDAATQYNFEPYYNDKKDIIEPNYSFDLCRLGCSLYDYFIDSLEDVKNIKSDIVKIIIQWCYDDKNRNILYKNTGEERYPEFKLYKMIARTVHNHKPCSVLENEHFKKYIVSNKNIKKQKNKIIDIDKLKPEY
ncbi:MAG: hypothetical protein CMD14_03910 [Flavobacteriales bacterium]|nr:hypothetical protein [Flavobacteriales bacterium]